ncbi:MULTISPECIES: ribosome-associated translation inhibitor RaiA [unclassified Pseudoalteromonas]|uniref:ribosome hibernation-promoting factor, HPF/YfiA family n=1 Tax=unclassified Pseudoalteromonas TaxID=194690 RepID=UPI000B3CAD84|nr:MULTISPECIES: ribosome-associated translation inhibitor RaiA [unclassified Pseudoalteromonas]MDN3378875.1 ribosome-associated translation inhibitor RaiA [Pseudoalteromonas sp. APC 3893]MDN3387521.1 ribosome-associated translation inhibitor RaiA [Pseudoalteromonas sp. APC 4017]OUS74148.1 ribosomal subunit interface protein [Pseudoalteromonas sp. A601]
MKINLSGHHVDVTDSIREHINEKFSKIASHFPSLIALDIILSKEHHKLQAEISTIYEGARLSVKGEDEVLYPAIKNAAKKLDAALKHRKGQIKANLHEKPVSTTPEIAHEKVQEMDLR